MKQKNEKISIIIPVYNVEPYLRQCIDSVVNQTYQNLEIILVDDGSPDNCGAICDEYARKDNRIVAIHKQNGGVRAARNDGIARATGEWIAFVDPDDWCETDYYEQLFAAMPCPNIDIFCAGGHFVENSGRTVENHIFTKPFLCDSNEKLAALTAKVLYGPCCEMGNKLLTLAAPWDKLYRTAFLRGHHLQFDVTLKAWDDVWFNFQAFDTAERIGGCACVGYHYRIVGTSIVHGFNPLKPQLNYNFIKDLYTYMELHGKTDLMQLAIKGRTIIVISNALKCYYFHPANTKPYQKIADEIKQMKMWQYFHETIYSSNNQYFSGKLLVLKYMLRLPWIWPLKLTYSLK